MNRSRVCLSPNMEDRRHAGLAGKRCSRLASQQQRQDVASEPLRPTLSGWLEARLNQESATCLYGRFGIDGLRTHTHSRVAGVVHGPTKIVYDRVLVLLAEVATAAGPGHRRVCNSRLSTIGCGALAERP
jgi:hypothetical protein